MAPMRARAPFRHFDRSHIRVAWKISSYAFAHGLILAVCLAQLWMTPHAGHIHRIAAHALNFEADAVCDAAASKEGMCCSSQFAAASHSHDGNVPVPCQQDDCVCCPLPFALTDVVLQQIAITGLTVLHVKAATSPVSLGAFKRTAAFAGMPRAPPILI